MRTIKLFPKKNAIIALVTILGLTGLKTRGQDNQLSIDKPPFDSLTVSNIKATGNFQTGALELRIEFVSNYAQLAKVHFSLGGFEGLGIIDCAGRKYKINTNDDLVGTSGINEGFKKIDKVVFGDKKFEYFTYVEQEISATKSKTLVVAINKFDKGCKEIKQFHIRTLLSLAYIPKGDGLYAINNIKIDWKSR